MARLSETRGIGRWSAEMFLIFRLGRPDVLPLEDLGIRKGVSLLYHGAAEFSRDRYGLPTKQEVARLGEAWRPYRTVAAWHLWRAIEVEPT